MVTPLFRQGAKPSAKVFLYSIACVCLMLIDSRVQSLQLIRQTIGTTLYPLQRAMLLPQSFLADINHWMEDKHQLSTRADQLAKEASLMAHRSQQYLSVNAENQHLRQLLELRKRSDLTSVVAEILYETHQPGTRKIIIDRGSIHGIKPGMPIMDPKGLLGQITRVFPLFSEANLIIDKDQATAVQAIRNGLRAVAYGGIPGDLLELRFIASNVDLKVGDELYTSGIDGVYPANLPVAKIVKIDRLNKFGFARIICQPLADVMNHRQITVITNPMNTPYLTKPSSFN